MASRSASDPMGVDAGILRDTVELRERQLEGAVARREQVADWWADKPDDFHRGLVLEALEQRVDLCERALEVACTRLAEVQP
jgi:hypothetical protein